MSVWLDGLNLLLQLTTSGRVVRMQRDQICSMHGARANKDGSRVFGFRG